MSALHEQMAALRAKANVADTVATLEQFRADFKTVWHYWRATGQISEQELAEGYAEASAAVRANQGDPEFMRCAMAHFRQMAEMVERERTRAEQIRAEVRAEKESRRAA